MAYDVDAWISGDTKASKSRGGAYDVDSWIGDVPEKKEEQGAISRIAQDAGVSALKGAVAVPEALVGLGDLVTGGNLGKAVESAGVRFKDANNILDSMYSDATKEAKEKFNKADGVWEKTKTAVTNPSIIATSVLESLPLMGAGGVAGRGVQALAKAGAVSSGVAGGVGEGIVSAGSGAEQVRQQTKDGLLTAGQSAITAVSGAVTGAIGVFSNKLAKRLGIGDIDELAVKAAKPSVVDGAAAALTTKEKGFVRKTLEGAVSEGLLEEFPQSVQEQVAQNMALGKPLDEGVDAAIVLGTLSGATMGAVAAHRRGAQATPAPAPEIPKGPSQSSMMAKSAFADIAGDQTAVAGQQDKAALIALSLSKMDDQERSQAIQHLSENDPALAAKITAAVSDDAVIQRGRQLFSADEGAMNDTDGGFLKLNHQIKADSGLLAGIAPSTATQVAQQVNQGVANTQQMAPAQNQAGFVPEATADLNAQMQAVLDGRKKAFFVGADQVNKVDLSAFPRDGIADIVDPFTGERGVIASLDQATVQQAAQRVSVVGLQQAAGEALGYVNPTATMQANPNAVAVQNIDQNGNIVNEQLVNTPAEAAAATAVDGTTTRMVRGDQALMERQQRSAVEQQSSAAVNNQDVGQGSTLRYKKPLISTAVGTVVDRKGTKTVKSKNQNEVGKYIATVNSGLQGDQQIDPATVTQVEIPKGHAVNRMVRAIRMAFGTNVVFAEFTGEGGSLMKKDGTSFGKFNAVAMKTRDKDGTKVGTIIVNASILQGGKISSVVRGILGHELAHVLQYVHPDIYADLELTALSRVSYDKAMEHRSTLLAHFKKEGKPEELSAQAREIRDEVTAEVIGEMAENEAFWKDVFEQIGEDKSKARRLFDSVMAVMTKMAKAFTGNGFIEGIKDLKVIRTAVTESYLHWARRYESQTGSLDNYNKESQKQIKADQKSVDKQESDDTKATAVKAAEDKEIEELKSKAVSDAANEVRASRKTDEDDGVAGLRIANELSAKWQKELGDKVKVVMGGSLISGTFVQTGDDPIDMDVRFLSDDPESAIKDVERVTGLKFRKMINAANFPVGSSTAYMIEGFINVEGRKIEVEGSLRNKSYVGWANYYKKVFSEKELEDFKRDKLALKGDKKAYKARKNEMMYEAQARAIAQGLVPNIEYKIPDSWSQEEGKLIDDKGQERGAGLNSLERFAEQQFYDAIADLPTAVNAYLAKNEFKVDADEAKNLSRIYEKSFDYANAVHEPSSLLSKMAWREALSRYSGDTVVITAGGAGGGKSFSRDFILDKLNIDPNTLTFDSALTSPSAADARIAEALAAGKKIHIVYTNTDASMAFKWSLGRENRLMKVVTVASSHTRAAQNIKRISREYGSHKKISIVIVNNYGDKSLTKFGDVAVIPTYDYNVLEKRFNKIALDAFESGELNEKQYRFVSEKLGRDTASTHAAVEGSKPDSSANDDSGRQAEAGVPQEGSVPESPSGSVQLARYSRQNILAVQNGNRIAPLAVLDSPTRVMQNSGLNRQLPIRMEQSVVEKLLTGKDGLRRKMTVDEILSLREKIQSPVAVFDDPSEKNSAVFLTDMMLDDEPVVVAINRNPIDKTYNVDNVDHLGGKTRGASTEKAKFSPLKTAYTKDVAGTLVWLNKSKMTYFNPQLSPKLGQFLDKRLIAAAEKSRAYKEKSVGTLGQTAYDSAPSALTLDQQSEEFSSTDTFNVIQPQGIVKDTGRKLLSLRHSRDLIGEGEDLTPAIDSNIAPEVIHGRNGVVEKIEKYKSGDREGQFIGAPPAYNTSRKIGKLRKMFRDLANEGVRGRFWYEDSGRAVLQFVGGDPVEARKFISLLAIYSPQAKVNANTTMALSAWEQYKAGRKIDTKTELQDGFAEDVLYRNIQWGGEKTNNFYKNLMREVDLAVGHPSKQGATIDMWMMRAAGYENDAPSAAQYRFVENETNILAKELGWEPQQVQAAIWTAIKARTENKGVKERTEAKSTEKGYMHKEPGPNGAPVRVLDNPAKHRALWLKEAFEHTVTDEDTTTAAYHFGTALNERSAQLSWEATPGASTGLLPGIFSAPMEQQEEYLKAIRKALTENGQDIIDRMVGVMVSRGAAGHSGWKGEVSTGVQQQAPVYVKDGAVSQLSRDMIELALSIRGLVLRQEGMAWHFPIYKGSQYRQNGVQFNLGRNLNAQETAMLYKDISEELGHTFSPPIPTSSGFRVLNFPDAKFALSANDLSEADRKKYTKQLKDANKAFHKAVDRAVGKQSWKFEVTDSPHFESDGNLIENDWSKGDGDYRSRIKALAGALSEGAESGGTKRPDLLKWIDNELIPKINRVNEHFSEKYDWGEPTIRHSREAAKAEWVKAYSGPVDVRVGTGTLKVKNAREVAHILEAKASKYEALLSCLS